MLCGKIEADLTGETVDPPRLRPSALGVGVRRLPLPCRGDRGGGPGQVIDVLVSARRDTQAAHRFFRRALQVLKVTPAEVVTDAAPIYPAVLDELIPSAWHHVERHANNPIEADHSQLEHRLRSMRGLGSDRTAQVITTGHAFVQNLRRGHYELGLDAARGRRVAAAFTELAKAI
jgi:IS6 family transposase